jgi:phospholipid/cholesterol/gamma-HCH transport system substrate-binding protein
VPSRKDIQWSQLKVGALVLAAFAILISLVFLMNASTGGFMTHTIDLRSFYPNAGGIKEGSPVTLDGVTIGNVTKVRVVPDRNPTPVEVVMQVGQRYLRLIHTDTTTSIQAAGVLGDSYIDLDSTHASGPAPANNGELLSSGAPTIQSVINTSQVSIAEVNTLLHKIEITVDSINSKRGTLGEIINDPALAKKIATIADDLQTITGTIAQGKGSLGKALTDDTLYNKLNTAVDQLNTITADLNSGKGSLGKFLKDETFYNNANATIANLNQVTAQINSGKGAAGQFIKDPAFAQKLDDTVTSLDNMLKNLNAGKGSAGQFLQNRSAYDHLDQTLDQAQQLIKGMRQDPKKYLVIQLKLF